MQCSSQNSPVCIEYTLHGASSLNVVQENHSDLSFLNWKHKYILEYTLYVYPQILKRTLYKHGISTVRMQFRRMGSCVPSILLSDHTCTVRIGGGRSMCHSLITLSN